MIYLASQSPRRQELLKQLGVAYELLLPGPQEDAESLEVLIPGDTPSHYVSRVVQLKLAAAVARRVARGLPERPILCADTTVAIGGKILGKPENDEQATRMLKALSGRSHRVFTAIAVARADGKPVGTAVQASRVTFARMSAEDIDAMVKSGEPRDKAGAYALQGLAAAHIRKIEGSPSGIIGLPLYETQLLLKRAGWPKTS
jgi:septum formation protein